MSSLIHTFEILSELVGTFKCRTKVLNDIAILLAPELEGIDHITHELAMRVL